MSFIIGCCIIAALFAIPLILYRKIYFKSVACVIVAAEDDKIRYMAAPTLPTGKTFRNFAAGSKYSFVQIAPGLFAFYVHQDGNPGELRFGEISFGSPVFIFARNRFGRFVSVSLSSRIVIEAVKKFKAN